MTTCFPAEMFNQRLIRGTDAFSSADLIFHFRFWCPTFINLQSRGEEEGEVSVTVTGRTLKNIYLMLRLVQVKVTKHSINISSGIRGYC